jgi:eukaryotic-like serine/threonine-protein kinase
MTTRFSVNPTETLPSFDIREQLVHRDIFTELLERSKNGELLEFPKIVETYPQLRAYRSYVLDLVYEDYCQRTAAGVGWRTAEYAKIFPEYDRQIEELLEVHRFFHASGQVPAWLTEARVWPLPGDEYLGYEICSELGRGAIGRVYLARERSLGGRLVALKVSPYGHDEANLLAKLNHPHVVPIHSIREDSERELTAVCMPYLGCTTLADLVSAVHDCPPREKSRRFWQELSRRSAEYDVAPSQGSVKELNKPFVETTLDLLIQVVKALVYVHEQNILHRDLKPSNILVTPDRVAMLLDFNLSADMSGVENRIGGTLPYMSPEQVEQVLISPHAQSTLDERTDIYSIGVICYELLSGKLPFAAKPTGVATKAEAIEYMKKIQASAEPLQRSVPDLDERTAKLVQRCLEFDKAKRPATARVLLVELEKCRGLKAKTRRSLLRHPRRLALGMALASLLLILAGFFYLTRPPFVERQIELGKQQTAAKEYSAAITSFREALAVEPHNIAALNSLGRVQYLFGDSKGAKESWSASYQLQPDPRIAACLGYLECLASDLAQAVAWFEQAHSLRASSSVYCNNLAHAYRLWGNRTHPQAFEFFEAALQLNPDLRQALTGRAYLAFVTDKNQQRPLRASAIQDVDRALALPNPYPDLLILGALCNLAAEANSTHTQLATKLVQQAMDLGFRRKDLESQPFPRQFLASSPIANYPGNRYDGKPLAKESPWIDPWPSFFELSR